MIDLDALEALRGHLPDGETLIRSRDFDALIAELRAARKVVEAARALQIDKIQFAYDWPGNAQRLVAALRELELKQS